ncbi:pyridoxamine 5'-phosphate oxidase family protein [Solicola sp. PLA-1-18]|uniref:pyridoxamine 5'-phosphate oxidase family protein n=1 Tax=Solicola sp. PLA-1-18 TaxID=3380532 RepID=UPI003B7972E4
MSDTTDGTRTDGTRKIAELAKDIRIGMLTTEAPDGTLVSRPMAQQEVEFDRDVWLFAERGSRKTEHIAANPRVAVTLTSNDTWVSLAGTAAIVTDVARKKELWNGWVEAWLPQGAESDEVVLIKVTAESGEYWDTAGSKVASAISFVKAKVTGERYDGGDNQRVEL